MSLKSIFRKKRTWLIIGLVVLIVPILFFYVMSNQFMMTDKELAEYFKTKQLKPEFKTIQVNSRDVFCAEIGDSKLPVVIFIHGAPGSWYDYVKFFGDSSLLSKVRLISFDRPGYGKSGAGLPMISIDEQAAVVRRFIDSIPDSIPVILSGHSFGGPIAARVAMDIPDRIKGMILLAPAIDPDNEKMFWVNKPAGWPVIKSMLPKPFRVAQAEKMSHANELRKMTDDWNRITSPTAYMYGEEDNLVPPANVEFAKRKLVNAPLEIISIPKEGHLLPWSQRDSISRLILKYASLH